MRVVFVEANCAHGEPRRCGSSRSSPSASRGSRGLSHLSTCSTNRRDGARQLSGRRRVVGVRHNIQGHRRDSLFRRSSCVAFRRSASGLTFDLCVTADQLPDASRSSCAVRHALRARSLRQAGHPERHIRALGGRSLVSLCMRMSRASCRAFSLRRDRTAHADALRTTSTARACFGAARLMYGSDWPVATSAGGEELWRAIVDEFISDWRRPTVRCSSRQRHPTLRTPGTAQR